jgi:hypothetical protein
MGTMHTPPIDLYDMDARDGLEPGTDDRETGFVLDAFPDDNGDRDQPAVDAGERKLHTVLGW